MYRTSLLIILLSLIQHVSFSQTTTTRYYWDALLHYEAEQSDASYSLTTTVLQKGKWIKEIKDLKKDFVISRQTESGEQQGIWHYRKGYGYKELNYDFVLSYSSNDCNNSIEGAEINDYFSDSLAIDYIGAKILTSNKSTEVLRMEDLLLNHLAESMIYPDYATHRGISGRVVLTFHITKNGIAEDIRVKKGVHVSLDKEAVRVIRLLTFSPAIYKGQVLDFCITLPVVFELED